MSSTEPPLSDHAELALTVLGFMEGLAASDPDIAAALRLALRYAAEISPLPEKYQKFLDATD